LNALSLLIDNVEGGRIDAVFQAFPVFFFSSDSDCLMVQEEHFLVNPSPFFFGGKVLIGPL
jgi:hypothetical protein